MQRKLDLTFRSTNSPGSVSTQYAVEMTLHRIDSGCLQAQEDHGDGPGFVGTPVNAGREPPDCGADRVYPIAHPNGANVLINEKEPLRGFEESGRF